MEALLHKALKLADQADVYAKQAVQHAVSFQASKLKDITHTEEEGWTLRLIKDGRLGSATTTKPGSFDVLLSYASNTAKHGSPVGYTLPGASALTSPRTFDPRVKEVSQAEMLDIAADLVSALNAYDPKIKAFAGVGKNFGSIELMNSAGFGAKSDVSVWSVYMGGELVNEDGFLQVYDFIAQSDYSSCTENIKGKVIESFRLAKENASIKPGQYPVIFAPGEVSCLVDPLLTCLNGMGISRGFSPFKGRIGELAFDPRFSLIDDALADGAVGSKGFDREGLPTSRRALIDQGRIGGYLLDLQTAHLLNMLPTGNGGGAGPVSNNTVVPGGDKSFSEMLAGIDEGVLIDGTMGAWAGNPYGGQVSGNISLGYKIEKGQVVGRIKDCMFSVNVFTDLRDNLAALSREQQWRGSTCYPYLQLANVNISTKG
ncbi:MAG: Metalloprotease TldD [Firmicutes bacterium]|nr:Metalloprotease TldD [candidate division NPL-UPA2 bacterium]